MTGSPLPSTTSDALADVLTRHLRRLPPDGDWTAVTLADLGLDSMTAIEVVVDIEETFGTQFPEELLVRETFATFGALESAVRSMVSPS
ncbi:acyl carrier protein [Actinokineospora auranticolor]|uniref:Acyl carrier protein n=1 Tax=Actinokineospora auranticolor TaxID=155976 RepID=A0A2S6H129_9PSEU|nr:acyl carrier protein [Actinokineospora auranticolor]PPK71188.1 acyl carrier protein [Actinokineospora auranticolor]